MGTLAAVPNILADIAYTEFFYMNTSDCFLETLEFPYVSVHLSSIIRSVGFLGIILSFRDYLNIHDELFIRN